MFDSLKKKLSSLFGKEEKEETKAEKKSKKNEKVTKKPSEKAGKKDGNVAKKPIKKETVKKGGAAKKKAKGAEIKEAKVKVADVKGAREPDETNEEDGGKKSGFFSRVFGKKEKKEEETTEKLTGASEGDEEEIGGASEEEEDGGEELEEALEETDEPEDEEETDENEAKEETREAGDEEGAREEEGREKKGGFFSRLLSGKSKITQDEFDEIFNELEIVLLENNVALKVVDAIRENLAKDLIGKEIKKGRIEEEITENLRDAILSVMIDPPNLVRQIKEKDGVYVIVFFGINGSGKTTSVAKLAYKLKKEGVSCVLAAADTFRAAAIQQLETHGERIGVPVIKHDYGADPTAVAFDAKAYAKKNGVKCVLVDTAGRMYTKENLIKQMEKLIRVIEPDLKIFVGESITGNDATVQAETFNEAVGIDGVILSKADVDEKGGTILSVGQVTGKPIYFLGEGQGYDDLKEFDKDEIIKKLGL